MSTDNEEVIEDRGDDVIEDRGDDVVETEVVEAAAEPVAEVEPTEEVKVEAETAVDETVESEEEIKSKAQIPKSRFDEVNNKRKEAEDLLREMQTRMAIMEDRQKRETKETVVAPEPKFDFDAKEIEKMHAMLDGDENKVLQINKEIRDAHNKEQDALKTELESYAKTQASNTSTKTLEQLSFEKVQRQLVTDYAEFQDGDSYDETLVADMNDLLNAYTSSGMASDQALEKASTFVLRGINKINAAPVDKKKTNVAKNLETARKQPPSVATTAVGESNGTTEAFDISRMSDAELEALPASKLAELRGDFV